MTRHVRVWIDPSCSWSWQTAGWLLDLRRVGVVDLSWSIFSLELNASPEDTPFWDAAGLYGETLVALALARRRSHAAFEKLYLSLGERLHVAGDKMSPTLVREVAEAAGLPGIVDEAIAMPELALEITQEFVRSRDGSVFGVPTIQIEDDKVLYGPLLSASPIGDDSLVLWEQVQGLSARPEFFELKRWPRDLRPGQRG